MLSRSSEFKAKNGGAVIASERYHRRVSPVNLAEHHLKTVKPGEVTESSSGACDAAALGSEFQGATFGDEARYLVGASGKARPSWGAATRHFF